ncbi:MAG: nucleoside deaminase [Vulcanimicrobiota bacterium]
MFMTADYDEKFMSKALEQARKAFNCDEVPVGAVIVREGKIISRGYNRKEETRLATRHAEIAAIEKACKKLNNWRLTDCEIFVTLEPCMMCLGAIMEARIKRIVYGTMDIRFGFLRYFKDNQIDYPYNFEYRSGVLQEDAARLMKDFFRMRRGG